MERLFRTKIERYHLYAFLALFCMLLPAERISVNLFDLVEIAIIGLFLVARPSTILIPMYIFYVFWYEALIFYHVDLSVGLFLDVIVAFRLWINLKGKITISKIEGILFLLIITYAPFCFFSNGSFSGFALVAELMIVLYLRMAMRKNDMAYSWEVLFFVITCSVILNTLYGLFNGTEIIRYLGGTSIDQVSGTTYPARTGIYCVCGLIYPFYYSKNKIFRIICSIFLIVMTLMTVSITAIVGLVIFVIVTIIFKRSDDVNLFIKRIVIIASLIVALVILYHIFESNAYISMIQLRFNRIYSQLQYGQYDSATSGRTTLHAYYIDYYNNLPIINKLFGTGLLNAKWEIGVANYSHLTYLDILICYGILGITVYLLFFIDSVLSRRRNEEFVPLLIIKLMMFILGAGGSLLTNTAWFVLFLL